MMKEISKEKPRCAADMRLRLYDYLTAETYIEPLFDEAYGFLENPLNLVDHTHQLITMRQDGSVPVTRWQELVEGGRYDLSLVDEEFYNGYQRATQTREVLSFPLHKDNKRVYVCSIMCRGVYMGSISLLEYYREVDEGDLAVLKTLAEIISVRMEGEEPYSTGAESQYSQILFDLLNGRIDAEFELDFRMRTRNWRHAEHHCVMLLDASHRGESTMGKHIRQSFASLYPDIKCIVHEGGGVLALLESDHPRTLPRNFEDLCQHYDLRAGLSDIFGSLLELPLRCRQAKKALHFGMLAKSDALIFPYRDYMVDDIVAQFCALLPAQSFYHPAAVSLDRFDQANNTNFAETFATYIAQNKSIKRTSELLHQHKNTVNYRIRRTTELFDLDLGSFKELVHLYLTYKMMEESRPETVGKAPPDSATPA